LSTLREKLNWKWIWICAVPSHLQIMATTRIGTLSQTTQSVKPPYHQITSPENYAIRTKLCTR
jgi:hypothetical protein